MNKKPAVLVIGELIVDRTIAVRVPTRGRPALRRSERIIYESVWPSKLSPRSNAALGGLFYVSRLLKSYADLNLVFATSDVHEEAKLVDEMMHEFSSIQVHSVSLEGRFYEALRVLELTDPDADEPDVTASETIVRVDAGNGKPITAREIDIFAARIERTIQAWQYERRAACILLCDYDLGLFTPAFVDRLSTLLPEGIPVVAYAGRKWLHFTKLASCTLVLDEEDAETMLSGQNDDSDVPTNVLLEEIVGRFPRLQSVVLVGRKYACAAECHYAPGVHQIHGVSCCAELDKNAPRAPVGLRALVAGWVARAITTDTPLGVALRDLDLLREINISVLSGHFSDHERERIAIGGGSTKIEVAEFSIDRGALLRREIESAGLVLDLRDVETRIPGIYTRDESLREQIDRAIDDLDTWRAPVSLFDGDPPHFVRKLWISGPPGSGKTTLGTRLNVVYGGYELAAEEMFACNGIASGTATDEAVSLIRTYIAQRRKQIALLDEADKIAGEARDVQARLLANFNACVDVTNALENGGAIVVITTSTPVADLKDDRKNLWDFFSRFPLRIDVPPLTERPLDVVYIVASCLYSEGIVRLSLDGLASLALCEFDSPREVMLKTVPQIRRFAHDGVVDREAFERAGIPLTNRTSDAEQWVHVRGGPEPRRSR